MHGSARIGEPRAITVLDHVARGKPVRLVTPSDARYPGTGALTLVDGVRGTTFNDGFWNGWWGPDLDATIDLDAEQPITAVTLSLLEQVNSWILYPESVELHVSSDGTTWQQVARRTLDPVVRPDAASLQSVVLSAPGGANARWVRVVARGGRRLPAWHAGAGQPAWIFADEIAVR
jgi:hexosaminidase